MSTELDPRHPSAARRQAVTRAASRYQVDAGLIASVLADEAVRWGVAAASSTCWRGCSAPSPRAPPAPWNAWTQTLTRRPLTDHSLGRAQMKLGTLREVAGSNLISLPDKTQEQVRLLLDPLAAPYLVAARLRQITDHWRAGGVDLAGRPEILSTLYSLGLTGEAGVHLQPQANPRGLSIAAAARHFAQNGRAALDTAPTAARRRKWRSVSFMNDLLRQKL